MQRLPEPIDLLNKKTVTLWLVICLSVLPMIVPVIATLSGSKSDLSFEHAPLVIEEDRTTARPLKAEVVDNTGVIPAGMDALGGSISSALDVMMALFAVLYIAYLGWRFTLRHQVSQLL